MRFAAAARSHRKQPMTSRHFCTAMSRGGQVGRECYELSEAHSNRHRLWFSARATLTEQPRRGDGSISLRARKSCAGSRAPGGWCGFRRRSENELEGLRSSAAAELGWMSDGAQDNSRRDRARSIAEGYNLQKAVRHGSSKATKTGIGGERGIRTLGRVSPTHAFQACSFNHSDISPFKWNQQFTGGRRALQKQTVT